MSGVKPIGPATDASPSIDSRPSPDDLLPSPPPTDPLFWGDSIIVMGRAGREAGELSVAPAALPTHAPVLALERGGQFRAARSAAENAPVELPYFFRTSPVPNPQGTVILVLDPGRRIADTLSIVSQFVGEGFHVFVYEARKLDAWKSFVGDVQNAAQFLVEGLQIPGPRHLVGVGEIGAHVVFDFMTTYFKNPAGISGVALIPDDGTPHAPLSPEAEIAKQRTWEEMQAGLRRGTVGGLLVDHDGTKSWWVDGLLSRQVDVLGAENPPTVREKIGLTRALSRGAWVRTVAAAFREEEFSLPRVKAQIEGQAVYPVQSRSIPAALNSSRSFVDEKRIGGRAIDRVLDKLFGEGSARESTLALFTEIAADPYYRRLSLGAIPSLAHIRAGRWLAAQKGGFWKRAAHYWDGLTPHGIDRAIDRGYEAMFSRPASLSPSVQGLHRAEARLVEALSVPVGVVALFIGAVVMGIKNWRTVYRKTDRELLSALGDLMREGLPPSPSLSARQITPLEEIDPRVVSAPLQAPPKTVQEMRELHRKDGVPLEEIINDDMRRIERLEARDPDQSREALFEIYFGIKDPKARALMAEFILDMVFPSGSTRRGNLDFHLGKEIAEQDLRGKGQEKRERRIGEAKKRELGEKIAMFWQLNRDKRLPATFEDEIKELFWISPQHFFEAIADAELPFQHFVRQTQGGRRLIKAMMDIHYDIEQKHPVPSYEPVAEAKLGYYEAVLQNGAVQEALLGRRYETPDERWEDRTLVRDMMNRAAILRHYEKWIESGDDGEHRSVVVLMSRRLERRLARAAHVRDEHGNPHFKTTDVLIGELFAEEEALRKAWRQEALAHPESDPLVLLHTRYPLLVPILGISREAATVFHVENEETEAIGEARLAWEQAEKDYHKARRLQILLLAEPRSAIIRLQLVEKLRDAKLELPVILYYSELVLQSAGEKWGDHHLIDRIRTLQQRYAKSMAEFIETTQNALRADIPIPPPPWASVAKQPARDAERLYDALAELFGKRGPEYRLPRFSAVYPNLALYGRNPKRDAMAYFRDAGESVAQRFDALMQAVGGAIPDIDVLLQLIGHWGGDLLTSRYERVEIGHAPGVGAAFNLAEPVWRSDERYPREGMSLGPTEDEGVVSVDAHNAQTEFGAKVGVHGTGVLAQKPVFGLPPVRAALEGSGMGVSLDRDDPRASYEGLQDRIAIGNVTVFSSGTRNPVSVIPLDVDPDATPYAFMQPSLVVGPWSTPFWTEIPGNVTYVSGTQDGATPRLGADGLVGGHSVGSTMSLYPRDLAAAVTSGDTYPHLTGVGERFSVRTGWIFSKADLPTIWNVYYDFSDFSELQEDGSMRFLLTQADVQHFTWVINQFEKYDDIKQDYPTLNYFVDEVYRLFAAEIKEREARKKGKRVKASLSAEDRASLERLKRQGFKEEHYRAIKALHKVAVRLANAILLYEQQALFLSPHLSDSPSSGNGSGRKAAPPTASGPDARARATTTLTLGGAGEVWAAAPSPEWVEFNSKTVQVETPPSLFPPFLLAGGVVFAALGAGGGMTAGGIVSFVR